MDLSVPRRAFGPVTVFFGEKNGKYPDGNQLVVRGGDTMAVFDSPLVANRIGAEFDEADLCILGHVHEDHITGLHRIPGAAVHAHEADIDAVRSWDGLARHYGYGEQALLQMKAKVEANFHFHPRPDAQAYRDGASWDLGGGVTVQAIHMPGHTSGHCVLLIEPVGVAFIGDIDLSGFGPYYGDGTSSLAQFRQTLKRVADLPASVWVTSHHRGAVTERSEFLSALSAFAAKIDQRSQTLLERLSTEPKSLDELVRQRLLYPVDYQELWVDFVERRTIAQHLDELLTEGRIERLEGERFLKRS